MGERERDERGQFTETATPEDVLALFDSPEPLTAMEVGEHLDISGRSALNKLYELHVRDEVQRKQVGARAVVWWRTGDDQ